VSDRGAQDEAVEVLGALIRHDTVNPPGHEGEAVGYLRSRLGEADFECEVLGG
jgi:acetylornithine deacetylase/succinyl-diaminopimelate desuccinylase-like protein